MIAHLVLSLGPFRKTIFSGVFSPVFSVGIQSDRIAERSHLIGNLRIARARRDWAAIKRQNILHVLCHCLGSAELGRDCWDNLLYLFKLSRVGSIVGVDRHEPVLCDFRRDLLKYA